MSFEVNRFYHVYNRGNNKEKIFFTDSNYHFFLKKVKAELASCCDIIAYCLMPNHYHLLIFFGEQHANFRQSIGMQNLQRKIGTLQSSYTRAINKQKGRVGSLFQARFKIVEIESLQQAITCFNYIHRNPIKAGLVDDLRLWHSSFKEYHTSTEGLCNQEIAHQRLGVPPGSDILEWMNRIEKTGDDIGLGRVV